jgi:hypothetical protein
VDTRDLILWDDLPDMPLVDQYDQEITIYCNKGFIVPRRTPFYSKRSLPHGVLMDLRGVTDLFTRQLDEEDYYLDDDVAHVDVYTYPQAGLKVAGHFQANGLMRSFAPFLQDINKSFDVSNEEGPGTPPPTTPFVHGIACQAYNVVMHATRGDSAQHHDAQLGMITGALAGSWAKSPSNKRTAQRLQEKCAHLLPHESFEAKIQNPSISRDLRLENVFYIDLQGMDKRYQDGK